MDFFCLITQTYPFRLTSQHNYLQQESSLSSKLPTEEDEQPQIHSIDYVEISPLAKQQKGSEQNSSHTMFSQKDMYTNHFIPSGSPLALLYNMLNLLQILFIA